MFENTRAFSGFAVDDLDAAKKFYGEVLGLKTSEQYGLLTLHLAGGRDTLVYPRAGQAPASYTILNFPVDDIEAAVDEHDRALALAHPMAYQVMFLRAVAGFEPSVRALTVATGAFDALATTVQRGIDAGVLAGPDAIMTAQVIWASIHGWMSLELLGIGPVEAGAEGFDLVCATALQGLHPNLVPGKRA